MGIGVGVFVGVGILVAIGVGSEEARGLAVGFAVGFGVAVGSRVSDSGPHANEDIKREMVRIRYEIFNFINLFVYRVRHLHISKWCRWTG